MGLTIFQVDAFAEKPFTGNPAAVCVLPGPRDARWMQSVAQEMNLSETAFLLRQADGNNLAETAFFRRAGEDYALRWFTPTIEVDLCGHATLASAHVLWEAEHLKPSDPARFSTRSGLLTAVRKGDWVELDFPAEPETPATPPPNLATALGVTPAYVGRNRFDYLVEVDSEETVRNLKPDFNQLAEIPTRGFIVTSRSGSPGFDFVSRFFAPRAGINEDPVTGSAHCCLGPFWCTRIGKKELVAHQVSARGGVVRVCASGERVHLGGKAVTVLRGQLL
jgi:PhzF family phenazine biosynthesis protein